MLATRRRRSSRDDPALLGRLRWFMLSVIEPAQCWLRGVRDGTVCSSSLVITPMKMGQPFFGVRPRGTPVGMVRDNHYSRRYTH